jgi:hypothetical protein
LYRHTSGRAPDVIDQDVDVIVCASNVFREMPDLAGVEMVDCQGNGLAAQRGDEMSGGEPAVRSTAKLCGLKLRRAVKKRALDTSGKFEGRKPFSREEIVFAALINDSEVAVPGGIGIG